MGEKTTVKDIYRAPAEFVAAANINNPDEAAKRAEADPAAFWAEQAEDFVWFKKWDRVLDDSDKPFYKVSKVLRNLAFRF